MLKPIFLIAALAVAAPVLTAAAPAWAASPRDALLVSPSWLASHMSDKDLVILHVGGEAGYQKGHIPGARLVGAKDLIVDVEGGLTTEMPTPDQLRQQMQALGISDRSRIVVYSETANVPRATRIVLTLDAAGFGKRTMLLDGGLSEWEKTAHATTTDAPQVMEGKLSALQIQPRIVDNAFVQSHLKAKGYDVIDGRTPDFYNGEKDSMGGKGHIPGAHNIPFTSISDENGKIKSPDELRALFMQAGVKRGDHVIAYCHIGFQATAVIFAARTLGINAQLYDGSFQDWVKHGLPVETSAAP
jgi:thiosulfate/3-mercaptopyruvate sulfurtransferase